MMNKSSMTIDEARKLLWSMICHCEDIECDRCTYKECLKEKAIDMYKIFVEGTAKSLGIEYDKPFTLAKNPMCGTTRPDSLVTSLEFVLKEDKGVMINDGSDDNCNSILDLIIAGDYVLNVI